MPTIEDIVAHHKRQLRQVHDDALSRVRVAMLPELENLANHASHLGDPKLILAIESARAALMACTQ